MSNPPGDVQNLNLVERLHAVADKIPIRIPQISNTTPLAVTNDKVTNLSPLVSRNMGSCFPVPGAWMLPPIIQSNLIALLPRLCITADDRVT